MGGVTTLKDFYDRAVLSAVAYTEGLVPGLSGDSLNKVLAEANDLSQYDIDQVSGRFEVVSVFDGALESTWSEDMRNVISSSWFAQPEGLRMALFRDVLTGDYTLAIDGTSPTQIGDLRADYALAMLGSDLFQSPAVEQFIKESFGITDIDGVATELHITGHSLGGFLVMNAAYNSGLFREYPEFGSVTTFNAPGLGTAGAMILNLGDTFEDVVTAYTNLDSRFVHFEAESDPVSSVGSQSAFGGVVVRLDFDALLPHSILSEVDFLRGYVQSGYGNIGLSDFTYTDEFQQLKVLPLEEYIRDLGWLDPRLLGLSLTFQTAANTSEVGESYAGKIMGMANVGTEIRDKISSLSQADLNKTIKDLKALREKVQYSSPTDTARIDHAIRAAEDLQARDGPNGDGHGSGGTPGGSNGSSSNGGLAGGGKQGNDHRPVLLDLDGDGVEFIPRGYSAVSFDLDNDGFKERTAWVGADDGLLVIDLNSDGKIEKAEELAFASLTPEDDTDLEALAKLYDKDVNGVSDGVLNANDLAWQDFRVWQDLNSNGVTDNGELLKLSSLGITQVSLVSNKQRFQVLGATVFGEAAYSKDGQAEPGRLVDMAFDADVAGYKITDLPNGFSIEFEGIGAVFAGRDDLPVNLDLSTSSFGAAFGSGGADKFNSGYVADADGSSIGVSIAGSGGDDTIAGGEGNDKLDGGVGKDQINGGDGDDTLFVDSNDTLILGGKGFDTAIVATGEGASIDLGTSEIEAVRGGGGADLLDASKSAPFKNTSGILLGVTIDGAAGDDTLIGSVGDDTLSGSVGKDRIFAGAGDDTIIAGETDEIDAGEGVDRVVFTDALGLTRDASAINAEILVGGTADDRFSTSSTHVVVLEGNAGDDFLEGSRGGDNFSGGSNDDVIAGGAGNDTYRFGFGDGQDEITDIDDYWVQRTDPTGEKHTLTTTYSYTTYYWFQNQDATIAEWRSNGSKNDSVSVQVLDYDVVIQPEHIHANGGADTIELGSGISQDDLVFEFRGSDLYVGVREADNPNAKASALDNAIRLVNWLDPLDRVENVTFADGTVVEIASLDRKSVV